MGRSDRSYLLARAEEERARACQTKDEIVRAVHLKLAYEYSVRANAHEAPAMDDDDVLGLSAGNWRMN